MASLPLHKYLEGLGSRFAEVNGMEVAQHFGDPMAEYAALCEGGGLLDLSFRGRLCLTGTERKRFLHGQVTNNVNDLKAGLGCYSALTTAKGKMQCDVNIYCLPDELLLDFEPGLSATVAQRLEKFIIADDVQVADMGTLYGMLSVQGPKAEGIIANAGLGLELPASAFSFTSAKDSAGNDIYCMNQPRGRSTGFDLFVPALQLEQAAAKLLAAAQNAGGRACGWEALEMVRIEAGIPRFGADMDETNLAPETGIESRAISYSKGCYIGQEVIARIRTYGQVSKTLRRLTLADDLKELPKKGDKLFHDGKEAGYITSALASPAFKANIALGYVRREYQEPGIEFTLRSTAGDSIAKVVEDSCNPHHGSGKG